MCWINVIVLIDKALFYLNYFQLACPGAINQNPALMIIGWSFKKFIFLYVSEIQDGCHLRAYHLLEVWYCTPLGPLLWKYLNICNEIWLESSLFCLLLSLCFIHIHQRWLSLQDIVNIRSYWKMFKKKSFSQRLQNVLNYLISFYI